MIIFCYCSWFRTVPPVYAMKLLLSVKAKRFSITVVIDASAKKCYDIVNSHHDVIKYSLAVGAGARSTGMLLTVFRTSCVSLFIGRSCSVNCPNTINDFLCSRKFIFIACNSQRKRKRDLQIILSPVWIKEIKRVRRKETIQNYLKWIQLLSFKWNAYLIIVN